MVKNSFIAFARPSIGTEEKEAVLEVLDSGILTTGSKVREFETNFASYVGAKHAVALNSCTAAMHLALEAIGLKEGDEVVTTPYTFAATAEVVRYFNARPVFIDIDPATMNIDPQKIIDERGKSWHPEKAKAVLPVHFAGLPAEMDSIMEIAARDGLKVVEDAAHALPTKYKGRMIGSIGDFSCFSFYATKTITTGEGGMVTTDDDRAAERIRIMSLHGISRDAINRYTKDGRWKYEITAPGFKYNLTDIAAALGIVQLKRAEEMRLARARIARLYDEAFGGLEAIALPPGGGPDIVHSRHLYVIRLVSKKLSITRDLFIEELKALGIGTSVHFIPLHLHSYYRRQYGFEPEDFPNAYELYSDAVSLPIYPEMRDDEVARVVDGVVSLSKKFGK